MKVHIFTIIFIGTLFMSTFIKLGFGEETNETCAFKNAVYTPKDDNRKSEYYFELNVEVNNPSPVRSYFFNFVLYRTKDGNRLSTMRLGDVCSNGIVVCTASAYYGQYNDLENLVAIEKGNKFALEYKMMNKDFSRYSLSMSNEKAPYAIIFTNTTSEFSFEMELLRPEVPQKDKSYPYIKFYEENAPIPVFSGKDVWVYKECRD